jgi:hypothetical protein
MKTCQALECASTCAQCEDQWNNFIETYSSAAECQADLCGHCDKCVNDYDNLDFFLTAYSSTEQCQEDNCNKCTDCKVNLFSKAHFTQPSSSQQECVDRHCHDCSKCAAHWDSEFMPHWGAGIYKFSYLSFRDQAGPNDGSTRYLSQEECEYYECFNVNMCEYYEEA